MSSVMYRHFLSDEEMHAYMGGRWKGRLESYDYTTHSNPPLPLGVTCRLKPATEEQGESVELAFTRRGRVAGRFLLPALLSLKSDRDFRVTVLPFRKLPWRGAVKPDSLKPESEAATYSGQWQLQADRIVATRADEFELDIVALDDNEIYLTAFYFEGPLKKQLCTGKLARRGGLANFSLTGKRKVKF